MSEIVTTTARDLIRRSMKTLGVLGEGENPSNSEASDALLILNEIVDKWNTESLMIPATKRISFNLSNKTVYTIGPSGDIDGIRPTSGVLSANFTSNGKDYPLTLISDGQYDDIEYKGDTAEIPKYYKFNGTFPKAEILIFPLVASGVVTIRVSDQFSKFNNLDAVIDFPSAYIKALRYNLAVELSIDYGRQLDSRVEQLAVSAKSAIKTINGSNKKQTLKVDKALLWR